MAAATVNTFRIAGWSAVGALLIAPAVAMRFTREVNWTGSDFVFAGVLLIGVGLALEILLRKSDATAYKAGMIVTLVTALAMVWANGAVGIIGDEGNDANVMFLGVLAIGVVGATIARFRAGGMAWTLGAMAAAQLAVTGVAVGLGWARSLHDIGPIAMFAAPWVVAAGLFWRAAEDGRTS